MQGILQYSEVRFVWDSRVKRVSVNGSVRFRQISAKLLQHSGIVQTAYLTLRPIASIGWLPSIMGYDDNSGGEIKAGDYWRWELR